MFAVQRVLFPIDLSGPWRLPEPLRSVIERSNAEIILLHAMDSRSKPNWASALARSMAQLEFIARRDFPGRRVIRRVERGEVVERILDNIRTAQVDLVAVPARSAPAEGRTPLGHVAREVLSQAPCAVWLEWPTVPVAKAGPVCCSIDGTETDEYLLQQAARWASELCAPLTIVQPLWAAPGKSTALFCDPNFRRLEVHYAESRLERMRRRIGLSANLEVSVGLRETVLSRAMQRSDARLLVTGNDEAALSAEGICPVWRMPRAVLRFDQIPAGDLHYAAAGGRAS